MPNSVPIDWAIARESGGFEVPQKIFTIYDLSWDQIKNRTEQVRLAAFGNAGRNVASKGIRAS